jgi:quercetin dioxygenase-like cupin family protein
MIEITKYANRESALDQLLAIDEDYTFIRHDFKRGEVIDSHKHPVDEWVIFNYGRCKITLESESKIVEARRQAYAIYLPKNTMHGLKCLTDISYWVLRKTE